MAVGEPSDPAESFPEEPPQAARGTSDTMANARRRSFDFNECPSIPTKHHSFGIPLRRYRVDFVTVRIIVVYDF
jgi:hypothetical protein